MNNKYCYYNVHGRWALYNLPQIDMHENMGFTVEWGLQVNVVVCCSNLVIGCAVLHINAKPRQLTSKTMHLIRL